MLSQAHQQLHLILRRCTSERGASLVEYALLVAFIAVACVGGVTFFGQSTNSTLNSGSSI